MGNKNNGQQSTHEYMVNCQQTASQPTNQPAVGCLAVKNDSAKRTKTTKNPTQILIAHQRVRRHGVAALTTNLRVCVRIDKFIISPANGWVIEVECEGKGVGGEVSVGALLLYVESINVVATYTRERQWKHFTCGATLRMSNFYRNEMHVGIFVWVCVRSAITLIYMYKYMFYLL